MSLTGALRDGEPEVFGLLYDEHAGCLHAYCRVMVGDEAGDAVRDAFIAAARHPGTVPSDEALPVWLYALARTECLRRGALLRTAPLEPSAEPLRRTLARLRPEHREVLALSGSLASDEIARVLGLAVDTTELLVRVAQRRLDQAAASVLGGRSAQDEAMLTALGAGKLYMLVGRFEEPPAELRSQVLSSCAAAESAPDGAILFDQNGMPIQLDALFSGAEDSTHPMRKVSAEEATSPGRHASGTTSDHGSRTVRRARHAAGAPVRGGHVTGAPRSVSHARPKRATFTHRRHDGLFEALGLATCVAAAAGVLALWPTPQSDNSANMDGTSVLLHRGATASRTLQPPVAKGTPPQNATTADAKKTPSPSPSMTSASPASEETAPPTETPTATPPPQLPPPTPVDSPPVTPTPTPSTPSPTTPTPTASSPTPSPSTS